jgi:hypothetical protein
VIKCGFLHYFYALHAIFFNVFQSSIMLTTRNHTDRCDRVLWRNLPGCEERMKLTGYRSLPQIRTSDHKPVLASFELNPLRLGPGVVASVSSTATYPDGPPVSPQLHGCKLLVCDLACSGLRLQMGEESLVLVFPTSANNSNRHVVITGMQSGSNPRWPNTEVRPLLLPANNLDVLRNSHIFLRVCDPANHTVGSAAVSLANAVGGTLQ